MDFWRGSLIGDGFLKAYQRSLQRLEELAEEGAEFDAGKRTPESLVSAVWFDQQLDHDNLRLADGRKLAVLSPGRWNTSGGPDFLNARVRFSGSAVTEGDVEIHVFASDWHRHKHSSDPHYASVILNVCMWDDLTGRDSGGPPLLELFPFVVDYEMLTGRLEDKYPFGSASMRGRCSGLVDDKRRKKALSFIAAAGEERIQRKAARMASLARAFGYDQTLYKGLMEAAGYSANKEPMSRLADVLHLDLIREAVAKQPLEKRRQSILALMYGCSGFFDSFRNPTSSSFDELEKLWEELRPGHRFTQIRGIRMGRVRPPNNPYRRMAAIAHLLAKISGLKLFDFFLAALGKVEQPTPSTARSTGRSLRSIFTTLSDPYWDYHCSATSARLRRPRKMMGDGLASIIVVNILAPLMLAFARQHQHWNLEVFLRELLLRFGGQSHNALTRFACVRIFGPENREPPFAVNALMNQGLLQIYYDFCRHLRKECPDCDFVDFLVEEGL
jgi:hypothetical protein